MKRSRIKHRKTKRSREGQQNYEEFRAEHCAPDKRCMICWARPADHAHHIVYRRGFVYDDPRVLLATCEQLCHPRLHGYTVVLNGVRYVGWLKDHAFEIAVAAKLKHDPDNYDPAYLDYLRYPERYERENGTMIYQETEE